jgi:hypothetical protein
LARDPCAAWPQIITPGFFEFAETRIERFIMALIGLLFCGILHVLATYKLSGLRE